MTINHKDLYVPIREYKDYYLVIEQEWISECIFHKHMWQVFSVMGDHTKHHYCLVPLSRYVERGVTRLSWLNKPDTSICDKDRKVVLTAQFYSSYYVLNGIRYEYV